MFKEDGVEIIGKVMKKVIIDIILEILKQNNIYQSEKSKGVYSMKGSGKKRQD